MKILKLDENNIGKVTNEISPNDFNIQIENGHLNINLWTLGNNEFDNASYPLDCILNDYIIKLEYNILGNRIDWILLDKNNVVIELQYLVTVSATKKLVIM